MRNQLRVGGLSILPLALALAGSGYAQNPAGFTPGSSAPATASSSTAHREDYDPLLDLPRLPQNRVTLVGGTVKSLDEVMNRMVVQPFGSKQKIKIAFDTRTRFFRDGKPITLRDVQQAQRVYVDTMLNGEKVFAKTIWIQTSAENGVGRGQITAIDLQRNSLTVRDELSEQPIRLQITPATVVRKADQPATLSDLAEGALVALNFSPQRELREITLLASPGSSFTFAGRVTYLDISRKLIAIDNSSDGKNYDISVEAVAESILRRLREGANISVSAIFDGNGYAARKVDFVGATPGQAQDQ
jgi:hypothetical protein